MQAVEIHDVEDYLRFLMPAVPLREPLDKFEDDSVTPHPLREAFEIVQRSIRVWVVADSLDVTMDPQRVGPICLERERVETFLADQSLRQVRAGFVEVMRAVGSLTDKHHSTISYQFQEWFVIGLA